MMKCCKSHASCITILYYLAVAASNGYGSASVRKEEPFEMDVRNSNSFLFIYFQEKDHPFLNITATDDDGVVTVVEVPPRIIQFSELKITIANIGQQGEITLKYWVVPKEQCLGTNFLIDADLTIDVSVEYQPQTTFCIFTGNCFDFHTIRTVPKKGDFYVSIVNHEGKIMINSTNSNEYYYSSHDNFYVSVQNKSPSTSKISYGIRNHHNPRNSKCDIYQIPSWSPVGYLIPTNDFTISESECSSHAEQSLLFTCLIFAGIIIAVLIMVGMHCAGWIDLKVILFCKHPEDERFAHLAEAIQNRNEVLPVGQETVPTESINEDAALIQTSSQTF